MKKSLRQAIRTERLYFDGGFGTMVQSRGLPPGTPPELWNISHPEVIEDIHHAYAAAGSVRTASPSRESTADFASTYTL